MPLDASEDDIIMVERKSVAETVLQQLRSINTYGSQSFTDRSTHPHDECSKSKFPSEAHPSAPQKPVNVPFPQQSFSNTRTAIHSRIRNFS